MKSKKKKKKKNRSLIDAALPIRRCVCMDIHLHTHLKW